MAPSVFVLRGFEYTAIQLLILIKGAVSRRNSAKLGNYKMPVKLIET